MTFTLNLVVEPPEAALADHDPVSWTSGYVAGTLRSLGIDVLACGVVLPERTPPLAHLERERHPTLVPTWEPTEGPGSGDDRYTTRPATEVATSGDGDGWAVWAEDDIPAAAETAENRGDDDAMAALDVGPGMRAALAEAAATMQELDAAVEDEQPMDPHLGGFHADLVEQRGDERRGLLDELAAEPIQRRPFDPDVVRRQQADAW